MARMPGSSHLRFFRIVATVVALGLLPLLAAVWFVSEQSRLREREALDGQLVSAVTAQRTALEAHFAAAQGVILVTAQNPSLSSFFELPGSRERRIAAGGPVLERINAALAYLERLYPRSIGEACLIDRSGAEIARVVRGERAGPADLSLAEAEAPFFAPSFARGPGRVYQARPYVSPDTGEWVISNSTVVPDRSGRRRAIVHFEVTIESFRRAANRAGGGFALQVVDGRSGRVVIDSRRPQRPGAPLGTAADPALSGLSVRPGPPQVLARDGRRLAVSALAIQAGNANRWYVVAAAPAAPSGPAIALLEPWSGVLVILLIGVGVIIARNWQRRALEALTDPLTGLPNRRLLRDRLGQMVAAARRNSATAAVMIIDIDRFKDVNDTLGHDAGDRLLVEVAGRLRAVLRESDTVARLGGDEFAVVAAVDGAAGALALAGRLRAALAGPVALEALSVEVEASVGIALFPAHGTSGRDLVRAADVAMFAAKESRAGALIYAPALDRNSLDRLELVGELRRALERDELVVHYQPKVNLLTGRAQGVEALVRWQHPRRGLLGPGAFIALAEQTALMKPLTLHVLERALADSRRWEAEDVVLSVSVNLSAATLLDDGFPGDVATVLERVGVPAERLELEITETVLMADPARALIVLGALHALGVRLAIDDFGVGYSSLSYLKRLPVDVLKIDRSFVMEMVDSAEDGMIVRSTIDLARNLGLSTVAEGVENEAALRELRDLDCDFAQGFHLCRPVPAEDLLAWIRARQPVAAGT